MILRNFTSMIFYLVRQCQYEGRESWPVYLRNMLLTLIKFLLTRSKLGSVQAGLSFAKRLFRLSNLHREQDNVYVLRYFGRVTLFILARMKGLGDKTRDGFALVCRLGGFQSRLV